MSNWPMLKHYDRDHLANIAMPIGGIGTGTVSLGGRGDLRDWELMNRPAKGFVPMSDGGRGGGRFLPCTPNLLAAHPSPGRSKGRWMYPNTKVRAAVWRPITACRALHNVRLPRPIHLHRSSYPIRTFRSRFVSKRLTRLFPPMPMTAASPSRCCAIR